LDALLTALHYCGAAMAGKPYMGVGRNLCYDREVFFRIGGFKSHYHVVGGDDDLFINEVVGKTKMQVALAQSCQTHSTPKEKFSSWFLQKRRHIETSARYRVFDKISLMLWPLSYWMWAAGWGSLFFAPECWPVIVALVLIRYMVCIYTLSRSRSEFRTRTDLILLFPVLELQLHLTNMALYVINLIQKPQKWK
jgi:hypothetical protein